MARDIRSEAAHIAEFNIEECKRLIAAVSSYQRSVEVSR